MKFANRLGMAGSAAAVAFLAAAIVAAPQEAAAPLAHFHHIHLNNTDPKAAIEFYTSKFDCEAAKFGGSIDAVWAQKSWIFFNHVNQPPPSEIVSAIYHMGWGAEDMKATYQKQLEMGTKFETPITDIAVAMGRGMQGRFWFAYVEGPDHALIELNTANHHHFGHIHLTSDDPVAAGEWYMKEFGMTRRGSGPPSREPYSYKGVQVAPSMSLMMDNVNFIIFPTGLVSGLFPKAWEGRTKYESPRGRAIDHFALSVDNLDQTLARLKADGVKVVEAPKMRMGGKLRSAFVEGPDNVQIEVVEGHATKGD